MRNLDEKLEAVEKRFEEVTAELAKPEVVSDPSSVRRLAKLRSELEPLVEAYRQLKIDPRPARRDAGDAARGDRR